MSSPTGVGTVRNPSGVILYERRGTRHWEPGTIRRIPLHLVTENEAMPEKKMTAGPPLGKQHREGGTRPDSSRRLFTLPSPTAGSPARYWQGMGRGPTRAACAMPGQ